MARNSQSDKFIAYLWLLIAGFGARRMARIRFYPCKLIVITFSTFVQFERVRAALKGVAPDEARLYQPMPDQIPYGRIDTHAFGLQGKEFYMQHNSLTQQMITKIPC